MCGERLFWIPKHSPDYTCAVAFIDRWVLWSIMLYEHKRALEGYWDNSFKTGIKLQPYVLKYDSSLLLQNITKRSLPKTEHSSGVLVLFIYYYSMY